jgi:hypothetical protein
LDSFNGYLRFYRRPSWPANASPLPTSARPPTNYGTFAVSTWRANASTACIRHQSSLATPRRTLSAKGAYVLHRFCNSFPTVPCFYWRAAPSNAPRNKRNSSRDVFMHCPLLKLVVRIHGYNTRASPSRMFSHCRSVEIPEATHLLPP